MTPAPANTPLPCPSRPRPRLRKAAKWGGLILSILLVAAWAASVRADFWYVSTFRIAAGARYNRLILGWAKDPSAGPYRGEWVFYSHPPSFEWSFQAANEFYSVEVSIPFWAITLPTIALTILTWRRDAAARRRALHNHCPACGYDRAGLLSPDAVCPECGEAAPTPALP